MKKGFVKIPLIIIILLIGAWIINETSFVDNSLMSIGDTSRRGERLINRGNNVISFEVGYFKKYVHILLGTSESENIEKGVKFDIINPNEEVVDSGILNDGKRFTEVHDGMPGEWQIILHFENDNSSTKLDYGYSITSKKKEEWR